MNPSYKIEVLIDSQLHEQGGFSIVEVMISMTTMFISMIVLSGAIVSVEVQGVGNKDKGAALGQVNALLEQMSAVPLSSLATLFPHDTEVAEFNNRGVKDFRVRILYADGDSNARPLMYELVATWSTASSRAATMRIKGVRAR